jgi:hypothetical protein
MKTHHKSGCGWGWEGPVHDSSIVMNGRIAAGCPTFAKLRWAFATKSKING